MEFSTHFTRTEVVSPILSKNVVPIMPYFFDTYIKTYFHKFNFIGLTNGAWASDNQLGKVFTERVLQFFF